MFGYGLLTVTIGTPEPSTRTWEEVWQGAIIQDF
jgi:hypothetical protein